MGDRIRRALSWTAAGTGLAVGVYLGRAAVTWRRYGHVPEPSRAERDPLLDHFMPVYEVVERHSTAVRAAAPIVLQAAQEQDLLQSPVVRAIFRARELALGASPAAALQPRGLLVQMLAIGWGILAIDPGREVVVGAVTQPWEADVRFRALPPDEFAPFHEPGFVKIIWTLRADPVDPATSIFRTETRAIATDPSARARFRRYWAFVSPGVSLIRTLSLGPLRREAERRARAPRTS